MKPFHDAYADILNTRLFPLRFRDISRVFGPKLDTATNWWGYGDARGEWSGPSLHHRPAGHVLPLVAPTFFGVSGIHFTDPAENKNHTDIYAVGDLLVGDIGYVEFYSQNNGEHVQTAVIYFCGDDKFVPLVFTNDLAKRLEWEKGKFDALRLWLDQHLPPQTDLGEVEVSPSAPSRVDLGTGTFCVFTVDPVNQVTATNISYTMNVMKETLDRKERSDSWQIITIRRQGRPVGFSMEGKYYRLTPKLVDRLRETR